MPTNKEKREKYNQLITNFNQKYGTDFSFEKFSMIINDRVNALIIENYELKTQSLATYKETYKSMAKKLFKNPKNVIEGNIISDFNKLIDDGMYFLTDLEDKKDLSTTYEYYSVNKHSLSGNNHYETRYYADKKDNSYLGKNKEGKHKYSLENKTIHAMFENQKFLESCDTVDNTNGIVTKDVGLIANGAMSQEEFSDYVDDQLSDSFAIDHYNALEEERERLGKEDKLHSQDLINNAKEIHANCNEQCLLNEGHEIDKSVKLLIQKVAPAYALLKEKRESRGFFGVLFHPFKAHAETVALKEIRSSINNLLKTTNLEDNEFDKAVDRIKTIPSNVYNNTFKNLAVEFEKGKERATLDIFKTNCTNLENVHFHEQEMLNEAVEKEIGEMQNDIELSNNEEKKEEQINKEENIIANNN